MAWEPVENGTYHTDGPELVKVSDAKLSIVRHNGNAYVDLPQGYALCRQVPDGEVSVPVEIIEAWEVVRDLVIIAEDAEEYKCVALNNLCYWFREMKGEDDGC